MWQVVDQYVVEGWEPLVNPLVDGQEVGEGPVQGGHHGDVFVEGGGEGGLIGEGLRGVGGAAPDPGGVQEEGVFGWVE